jgi:hypothetical protein
VRQLRVFVSMCVCMCVCAREHVHMCTSPTRTHLPACLSRGQKACLVDKAGCGGVHTWQSLEQ